MKNLDYKTLSFSTDDLKILVHSLNSLVNQCSSELLKETTDDISKNVISERLGKAKDLLSDIRNEINDNTKSGINLVAEERIRQILIEGWTREHDDKHPSGALALAASSYAIPEKYRKIFLGDNSSNIPPTWPFSEEFWKPTPNDRIKELKKAGALIVAEIDHLLNSNPQESDGFYKELHELKTRKKFILMSILDDDIDDSIRLFQKDTDKFFEKYPQAKTDSVLEDLNINIKPNG